MPLANRLWVHEIDEVSGVDRDANGFAKVLITKRDPGEDNTMGLFDADGNPVDENDLQPGDYVYDGTGPDAREFRYLDEATFSQLDEGELSELDIPDDASGLYEEQDEDAREGQYELVGKSAGSALTGSASAVRRAGSRLGTSMLGHGDGLGPDGFGGAVRRGALRGTMKSRAAISRRPIATATGVAAAGYGGGRLSKSMGDQVLETLSKALGDSERDQIISKAINQLQQVAAAAEMRATHAERVAKSLEDQAILNQYIELADEYDVSVDSREFGEILATIGQAGFSKRQLDVLDTVFTAAGMNNGAIFNEIGAVGSSSPNSVLDQVQAVVSENIAKADITAEQAMAAVFESNPELYAAYEAEQRSGLHR